MKKLKQWIYDFFGAGTDAEEVNPKLGFDKYSNEPPEVKLEREVSERIIFLLENDGPNWKSESPVRFTHKPTLIEIWVFREDHVELFSPCSVNFSPKNRIRIYNAARTAKLNAVNKILEKIPTKEQYDLRESIKE